VPAAAPHAFAVVPDAATMPQAIAVLEALRAAGVSVQMHAAGKEGLGSMRSQFKKADASGARFALVFGADELAQGTVAIKPLRDSGAAQWLRPLADAAVWAHELRNA
jgi:histidyl-tRNA synthetase